MNEIEELAAANTAAYDAYLDAADTFDDARKARDTAYAAYKAAVDALTTAADKTNFVSQTATAYLAADTAANDARCNIRDIEEVA